MTARRARQRPSRWRRERLARRRAADAAARDERRERRALEDADRNLLRALEGCGERP